MKMSHSSVLIAASLLVSMVSVQAQNTQAVEAKAPSLEKFALSGIRVGERTSDVIAANGFPTHLLLSSESTNATTLQVPAQNATILKTGALPDWASAVSPPLDNNRVLWLYNRDTYALAFVIDSLGTVDAAIVAGVIPTRSHVGSLEGSQNTVKLGDDLRKLIVRYGYPENITAHQSKISEFRDFTLNYKSFAATVRNNRVVRLQLNASAPQN